MEPESASVPLLGETRLENSKISALESASVPDADTVKNTHNTYKTQSEAEVSSSDVLKSLFARDFCHVCGAVLQFESQRVSHYEGKKHAQKVRLYLQTKREEEQRTSELTFFQKDGSVDPDRFCQLCNMVFSAPVVAKSHYEGKVHAKNLKKLGMQPTVPSTPQTVSPRLPPVLGDPAPQGSPLTPSSQEEGKKEAQEEEEEEEQTSQEPPVEGVDLNDPNKHCRLCVASFNNPQMARQHYTGRKHQRNHVRYRALQEMEELGRPGAHLDSRTFSCPVCNVTLNSVEMYQAHMQGNKHQQKELRVSDMIFKSQKKVYDCFQDELADYIQVQKARGLEPRTRNAAERGGGRRGGGGEGGREGASSPRPRFVPRAPEGSSWGRSFPPVAPPFAAAAVATGFRSRPRRGEAGSGGFIRERTRHRRSNRDRSTSSASSTTSSSSSSSSSSSNGSDNHRRRERRRKRMRKERGEKSQG
ncbi:hypothetical protein SKAU_G00355410 [Synaphobranchus kaupii]|uniref:C2H2-type domain-containing protein n=1 Tax=Synaphobranchus kaupii TaxID=118154 RepID=A0A9Q1EHA3_SYNKA|nr:hypothetical protein SKAU_G00355410 [Synaphobranchus kaupii]